MIYKQKGRQYFKVKFHFQGQLVHKATRARTKKDARTIESTLRSELAKGNWGILEMKASPKLGEFLKKTSCLSPDPIRQQSEVPAVLRVWGSAAVGIRRCGFEARRSNRATCNAVCSP